MISYDVKSNPQFSYAARHCFRASLLQMKHPRVIQQISLSTKSCAGLREAYAGLKSILPIWSKVRNRQQHLATQYCNEGLFQSFPEAEITQKPAAEAHNMDLSEDATHHTAPAHNVSLGVEKK